MRIVPRRILEYIYSSVIFVVFLAAWEFIAKYYHIQAFILPAPSDVATAFWRGVSVNISNPAGFYIHTGYTVGEALAGFVAGSILGIVIGTLVSQSRFVERVIFPYILAFQCLPKIAVAPLLIVWFSTGFTSKVVIAALLTFFPLLVNSMAGFESVNAEQVELMRSFRATKWQIFRKVRFPNALPFIFAGLNMAIVYSLIGAIVGEFLGARRGLGILILHMNDNLNTAGVFAIFIILAAAGMIMYGSVRWVEKRMTFWSNRSDNVVGL